MKKTLTIMLSALIVLSSLTCVFIAPVSAAVNLWNGISAADWYTKQVIEQVGNDQILSLEQKQMTAVYPEKFTYGSGSFSLSSAGGKHYYVKMPALEKNKDYTVSFNYSVTKSDAAQTPNLYKALVAPESIFTEQICWNGFGAMMSNRSNKGVYDIHVNKPLSDTELTGTVTYTFNTKTHTQYYLFLNFDNIDVVTYSNFSIIDPLLVEEEESDESITVLPEDDNDIWTEYSVNDWFTKQVDTAVSDGRDIPQKSVAEAYGDDFTYNASTKSFKLENAGGRYYYVKLPTVQANKNYTLSVDYLASLTENKENKFASAILVPANQFANQYCWKTNGEIWADRTFVDIYDIVGGANDGLAPGGIVLNAQNRKGNITYNFNSGRYTEYYVYFKFDNVKSVTYYNLALIDPDLNLKTEWKTTGTSVITAVSDAEKGTLAKMGEPWYKNFYYKLSQVEKNKDYTLSFSYKAKPYTANGEGKISKFKLATEAGFNDAACWNGGSALTGDMYDNRQNKGVTDVENNIEVDNTWTDFTYDFNSGNATQFYFYIKTAHILELTLTDISVKEKTVTPPPPPPVIPDEPDEPITVLPEDAADIWTEYSADDWFTRQVSGGYSDGRDIPEKTVAEAYGADFSYNAENKSFKLKNAGGRYYYVKLPKVKAGKNYTLSLDYLASLTDNQENKFEKAILVPKDQFKSEFCWTNNGDIWADRTFVDIYDIVGGKDDGLAPDGIVLNDENRKGNITYNFNSGRYTEYYVFFKFQKVKSVTYYNLSLIDLSLKPDYKGNALNYGVITPSALPEGTKAGDVVEFTTTPFKGNTFIGWYDGFGNLLSNDINFSYTVPKSREMPVPYFDTGAVKVPNASLEDSVKGLLAYYDESNDFKKTIVDENYDVEYNGTPKWQVNIQAHTEHARTGKYSVKIQTPYCYSGRHFKGLEKNTDYAISFWAYINADSGLSLNAMVLPKGVRPYKENSAGEMKDYPLKEAMGVAERAAAATSSWQEVVVKFNSGENTDVTLWFISRGANSDRCWVDDFALFKPVSLEVVGDLGGSVTATQSGVLAKETEITVTATPDKGNTFKHWLDREGNTVSTSAEYTFTITEDTYLKAVFDGYNKPSREIFALRGDDGTFENGTISGIYHADVAYPDSLGHCKTTVSTAYPYEGAKSLEITSYYRNTIIPLSGLNQYTNYRFSYYVRYPYKGESDDWNQINSMMICGADDIDGGTANKIFAQSTSYLAGDAGWYKVELYFYTGDDTAVNFIIRYGGEPKLAPTIYMDNVELYEYHSSDKLSNGSMTDTVAPWIGNGELASDNTLKLTGKDATAYQILGLGTHGRYIVKFRAKGNVFAAASNVSAKIPNIYNALSSESYITGNSDGFKEYSFEFYTGIHKGVAVMFSSLGGDVYIDDVTVTKILSPIGGVIENVDFESDRFALSTHTNYAAYEIYTAKSSDDENVHSGSKSLHFKYDAERAELECILDEAYLSYGVAYNHNYMLSLYYKYDSNTKKSVVNLEPNYRASYFNGDYGDYSGQIGYEHPTTKGEWKQLRFVFTASDFGVLKAAIYNIVGKTDADFYVDDIKITVASDLVVDEKTKKAYTTDFYNMFTNPSFEKSAKEGNWVNMPDTMKIVKNPSLADTSDSFLMVSAGTKYVLPLDLNPSEVYYFGASIRSFNGGKGRIYLATLTDPTTFYFTDLENNPKSIIVADSADWKHEGFGFRTSPTGETYMVVECTEGSIGIDTVSLTPEKHANEADYNYYRMHIPFDYDNIDPSIMVYNGGVEDETEEDSWDEEESEESEEEFEDEEPESEETDAEVEDTEEETGKNNIALIVALVIGAIVLIGGITAVIILFVFKNKRKDETDA